MHRWRSHGAFWEQKCINRCSSLMKPPLLTLTVLRAVDPRLLPILPYLKSPFCQILTNKLRWVSNGLEKPFWRVSRPPVLQPWTGERLTLEGAVWFDSSLGRRNHHKISILLTLKVVIQQTKMGILVGQHSDFLNQMMCRLTSSRAMFNYVKSMSGLDWVDGCCQTLHVDLDLSKR